MAAFLAALLSSQLWIHILFVELSFYMCRFVNGQRALVLLELELKVIELQAVVSFLIQVLRAGARSSARMVGKPGCGDGSVLESPGYFCRGPGPT